MLPVLAGPGPRHRAADEAVCRPANRKRRWYLLPLLFLMASALHADPAPNLIANSSFEDGSPDALPGWERLPWAAGVALDGRVVHSGKQSLRVFAPGGFQSQLVAYPGGRAHVVGWVKTESIVRGPSAPWHMAALQLISYDAERKSVGHHDIVLTEGTHEWARYEGTAILSRDVAFVSVHCHIWGEDARGTVWFDDVSLDFPDAAALPPRPPMDLAKATVTADFGRPLGPFRHLWIGSDVGYSDRVLSELQLSAMREARKAGFRYLRLHDCIFDPQVYSEDADGHPRYDWTGLDRRLQAVLGCGMWPVVVLETMPVPLAGRDDGLSWTNPYPPQDAAAYLKWQALIRELVKHCRERWGEDIHQWYFEVWNEPESAGYFKGTLEEYLRIYDHAVAGALAADPGIRIGGPGGAGTSWTKAFLEHCRNGPNDATGATGCRADFLSWHIYTVGVGLPTFDALRASLAEIRQLRRDLPEYRDLPTLVTEWGCSSSRHPVHDRPYDAAYRALAVHEFMDSDITLALPFAMADGPYHAHDGYQGDLGLFTKVTVPKPSFRAFELLGRMVGTRVACGSSNDPVGGLACISPDGRRAWVLLHNLVENHARAPYATAVTVQLRGLPEGDWTCAVTAIAPGGCDPFLTWERLGRPETLSPEQRQALLEASQVPPANAAPMAAGSVDITVPGFSVALLELTR